MALTLSSAPQTEPVTIVEAKAHCRVVDKEEDSYIRNTLIPSARQDAEEFTCRAAVNQTWVLKLSYSFGSGPILVPKPPLSSVTSVQYVDANGETQTWAASKYTVEAPSGPRALHGSIRPAYNESYPTVRDVVDAITITFVAGYGAAAAAVPVLFRLGVLFMIEDMYAGRGSQVTGRVSPALRTARSTLSSFRACRDDLRLD